MSDTSGARQRELLEAWATTARTNDHGQEFDFTESRHTHQLEQRSAAFVENPTERTFEALWSPEAFRGAVMGGVALVRNSWESIDAFAAFVRSIREADAYDTAWEENFVTSSMVWELYGRLHPEREPILSGNACQTLHNFGYGTGHTFADTREKMLEFREQYESVVGHATAGTDHEVPLWDEIEMFLHVVHVLDDESIAALATNS